MNEKQFKRYTFFLRVDARYKRVYPIVTLLSAILAGGIKYLICHTASCAMGTAMGVLLGFSIFGMIYSVIAKTVRNVYDPKYKEYLASRVEPGIDSILADIKVEKTDELNDNDKGGTQNGCC